MDLATCDFAALAEAAGAQLPPRHRAVAFHFQGKAIGPGSAPLASYGVRRGDTLRADVRRDRRSSSRGRGRLFTRRGRGGRRRRGAGVIRHWRLCVVKFVLRGIDGRTRRAVETADGAPEVATRRAPHGRSSLDGAAS